VTTSADDTRDRVVLALTGITKRFGPTTALDDVSFSVQRGTVHALLGENGAGKTTLMRIAFGLAAADGGQVLGGTPLRPLASPADAIAAGIGMVHQHFTNVPAMTVAENIALGGRGLYFAARAAATVANIARRTGLAIDPAARAEDLPVGAQQRLEIVKALARAARLLILDEPTAVLAPREIEELLRWLRAFANDGGSVVLITHKLRESLAIADEITVLRRGRVVRTGAAALESERSLGAALLGEDRGAVAAPAARRAPGPVVAAARHAFVADHRGVARVRDATFEVRAGEIVGVAAVEGSGQRELLRALAARATVTAGELTVPDAVAFVPEDRHRDALVLDFSSAENIALKDAGIRRGRMDWPSIRAHARALVARFDVRGAANGASVRTMSGGNQQKLVLARELDGAPALLVVENPTRGLDIRATQDIHERLRRAAEEGAAVVVFSSDLDEVLALAHRVIVMYAGGVRECARDRDVVGRAMLGVA